MRGWRALVAGLWLASQAAVVAAAPASAARSASSAASAAKAPSTYYVRMDGGSAGQCDGKSDLPYRIGQPGPGSCAWKNPMIALPPGAPARMAGGDTLLIDAGSYMLGFGGPGADTCSLNWPWDCVMSPVPSGPDAAHPTRILGRGHDGACEKPPELWGTERAASVLSLVGTRHAEVSCLDITDRSGCAEFHSGSMKCERDNFPYGQWARNGIVATDSSDVQLNRLNIHGLANAGIQAGRLKDWTLSKVRIAANGWVGWNGDVGSKTSSNSGTLRFSEVTVEWNGCPEALADRQPAGCWGQGAGGYGDGVGTAQTGGVWVIEDSRFSHNTQDGLDLLYHTEEGSVTLRRVWAEGNAGNQIKVAGNAVVENSVIVGNCGFFKGKPYNQGVDDCRALGDSVALFARSGKDKLLFANNTVVSEGNTALVYTGPKGAHLTAQNNILIGRPYFLSPGKQSADLYVDPATPDDSLTDRFNLKMGLRNVACRPEGTLCLPAGRPVLVNDKPGQIDPRPAPVSAARGSGMVAAVGAGLPQDDLYRRPRSRTAPSTRGAVEITP